MICLWDILIGLGVRAGGPTAFNDFLCKVFIALLSFWKGWGIIKKLDSIPFGKQTNAHALLARNLHP